MARATVILAIALLALLVIPADLVLARKHPNGGGHHKKGGGHRKGGHHKSSKSASTKIGTTKSGSSKGSSAACAKSNPASTLKGFKKSVDLNGKGLVFHWNVTGTTVYAAIEAKKGSGAEKGYGAVGWSPSGKMLGDAVLASSSKVTAYKMTAGWAIAAQSLNIGTPKVSSSNGGFVATFTRKTTDGSPKVNPTGDNTLVYAWSSASTFGNHGTTKRGFKVVNFAC
eukprot:TRINITY_DN13899_c0_g1_i1.p1 TRINITY_DN13899_c0_g1~~TRINITY_DN13899_c0_g1_i1.p1  ORF type:complete len:226 (-),score=8.46 TRINITY_DN13899_c0_g1_i1:280-957(-)